MKKTMIACTAMLIGAPIAAIVLIVATAINTDQVEAHKPPFPPRGERSQQSPSVISGKLTTIPISERSGDHIRLHLESGQVKVDFNDEVTTYEDIRRIDVACGVVDFFTPEGRRIIVSVDRCAIEDGLPKPVIGR